MHPSIFTVIFICLFLSACDCSYQYNVFVKNNTGETIRIDYKTKQDVRGVLEETVMIDAGEFKQIITSKDLNFDNKCGGCKPEHCHKVAEYINAYLADSIPSKIRWCDKTIKFIKADIQQGEFVITYNE
jgi:hypothetical protein